MNTKVDQLEFYSRMNLKADLKHKFFGFPQEEHFYDRKEEKLYLLNYPGKGKQLLSQG